MSIYPWSRGIIIRENLISILLKPCYEEFVTPDKRNCYIRECGMKHSYMVNEKRNFYLVGIQIEYDNT